MSAKVSTDEKDEMEIEEPKDVDEHPYALGHALIVNYRDGSERLAKIIERTKAGDNGNKNNDDDDNDGLVDAFELFTSQTNPYNPDHDGDEILEVAKHGGDGLAEP